MRVIGLDIGGANLKASDGERRSESKSFPLWQHPERLSQALQDLLSRFAKPQHLAVTMTGELADCFETKAEGARRILKSVTDAVDIPVHVWQLSGEFVSPNDAAAFPKLTAAANWHALATWAGRMTRTGCALLLDMGSTTTDIIPIVDGLPKTQGQTDLQRLATGELVYTGCRRTPICAVTQAVRLSDDRIPLAAESFATMHDVGLILGDAKEDSASTDTADGRPATIDHGFSRLARMLCCDRTEVNDSELRLVAHQVQAAQEGQLQMAMTQVIKRLPSPPSSLLISGEGESTLRRVITQLPALDSAEVISLQQSIGPEHSTAACAFALARLGNERIK